MARSIAQQSVDELGGDSSVLSRQREDHQDLDRLLDLCLRTTGDEQRRALTRTWRLVFTHAFAEEAVLWPAARRVLPDGEALTLRIEQEHQQINQLVTQLEAMTPGDPGFEPLLVQIVELLRQDVRDEEDVLLPRLQAALDRPQLQQLGRTWATVRGIAPTRPHPAVSRRPPGNILSAMPLTLIDRSRDALDHQAQQRSDRIGRWSEHASRSLARAAGVVEHAPFLRRGEDPSTRQTRSVHR